MSLATLLNQTIIVYTKGAQNEYGKNTFGSGTSYRARFEQKNMTVATAQKDREPIDGVVFVSSSCVVGVGDKLTYDEVDYRVMSINKQVVGGGTLNHQELLVQLWSA